jgi:hypothetical protein
MLADSTQSESVQHYRHEADTTKRGLPSRSRHFSIPRRVLRVSNKTPCFELRWYRLNGEKVRT